MTYDEIHPALRGVLGIFEGLRKLGFVADDIYVEVAETLGLRPDDMMVFVALKTQGREFLVGIAPWPRDKTDDLQTRWAALCAAMNGHEIPQKDMNRIWQESIAFGNFTGFAMAIAHKGIAIPNVPVPPLMDQGASRSVIARFSSTGDCLPGQKDPSAPPESDELPMEFRRPCVFCNGTVIYPADRQGVTHSKPPCKKFKRLDVLAFVEATNERIRQQRKESLS